MSANAAAGAIKSGGARLPPLPTIRDLIRLYRLRAIKQLSQNFLMDERLTDKIVRAAGSLEGHHVLEVGPGPGGITRSIIRQAPRHLVLVEKDPRFRPTLELLREASAGMLHTDIHIDDILRFPAEAAFDATAPTRSAWDGPRAPVHLIGNLPFAISTRLLINWLHDVSERRGAWSYGRASMTLTFQKEVADRIVAPMLNAQRCRLSVMSQLWTKPQLRFEIPGRAFVPKPDVDVGVVTLVPYIRPLTNLPFGLVEKVVRHIFSMRQKYCQRGVENLYPEERRVELTQRTFQQADVDPQSRSFQLSNEECVRLAEAYASVVAEWPEIEAYNYRACKKPQQVGSVLVPEEAEDEY